MPRELTIFDFGRAHVDAVHVGDLALRSFPQRRGSRLLRVWRRVVVEQFFAKLTNERAWRRCRCRSVRGTRPSRWLRGRRVPVCGPFSRATNAIAQQNQEQPKANSVCRGAVCLSDCAESSVTWPENQRNQAVWSCAPAHE